jgi:dTDP-L-rhamnose 4-epimerase
MVILVTGGAGFVGSHVVDELATLGHEVRVLDLLHPGAHDAPPAYLRPDVAYVWGDVADPEVTGSAVHGVDAVCHQAAMVGLGADFADVDAYVRHNDLGTAVLLRALHDAGFTKRIVLASSMVVYGEGRYRCARDGAVQPGPRSVVALERGEFEPPCPACGAPLQPETVPEDAPLDPRNVYAATKLHQEHLVRCFAREHAGVVATALRYHNVYGPRMPRDTPYAGVASIFRSALARDQRPRVFEDGAQRRDFVHVRDVAHANVLALTHPDGYDGALNVGSGTAHTVGEMATTLAAAFGRELEPEVTGAYRLGDVRHIVASSERAAAALGYRAQVPFEVGMREFASAALR